MDEDVPTLEDLIEELTATPVEPTVEQLAWKAEQERIAREQKAREDEFNRLRRPYHDRVFSAFAAFARIPLAHLAGGSGRVAEATRARIDGYLKRFGPGLWDHWGKTLGSAACLITEDYFDLEEYQPKLMKQKDDDELNIVPWEQPYEPPAEGYYPDDTAIGAAPDAPERDAKIKEGLARIMPCMTELVATAIDVLELHGVDTHRADAYEQAPSFGEGYYAKPLYAGMLKLPAAAREDAIDRFTLMGMTEDEARTTVSVLLEIPFCELEAVVWFFYDDEEPYGFSKTTFMLDLSEGEGKIIDGIELSRQELINTIDTVASDTVCHIKTAHVSADDSQPIAAVVRDLAAGARTDDEYEALLAIGTYNKLLHPLSIMADYRIPRC
ncbi:MULTISPECIES: hypothetical protein [Enorma]|uniref:hypothetical protein n=1 Tax=Enorma TaxID=1472762 RepID=UPI000349D079|nr:MULTISPECIES: hypothetical protein [Enorma]